MIKQFGQNTVKPENFILSNSCVKVKILKVVYLWNSNNKNTKHQIQWKIAEAIFRGKFIALNN